MNDEDHRKHVAGLPDLQGRLKALGRSLEGPGKPDDQEADPRPSPGLSGLTPAEPTGLRLTSGTPAERDAERRQGERVLDILRRQTEWGNR